MRQVLAVLLVLLAAARGAAQTPVTQVGALSKTATLQSAATATGNGTALAIDGYATLTLTVNCSSCAGGTTVNFEGSEDGINYSALLARQAGTTTIATSTTTAGITVWVLPTSGFRLARARISGYSAGTVTVTGHALAVASDQGVVNVANIPHVIVDTAPTTTIAGTVTANAGTNLNTAALALDATLTGGTQQTKVTDGTNVATVKAASTAAGATDKALVVAVSPNNSVAVTGTVTTTPPSNASTNVAQFGGSTVTLGQQTAANSIPVILPTATVTTLTPPAAITGFALEAGNIATVAGAVTSSVMQENVKQVNGVTVLTGTGATGTGAQRVTVAVDAATVAGSASLPAGSNVIGHVIADSGSTTAVTGNVTVVQPTGTNLHTVLDATSTTAATQATASNFNAQVQGAGASGASKAGNPVQVGGVFNTTQPTVTTGQTVESQYTARGAAIVATGTDAFSVTCTNCSGTGASATDQAAFTAGASVFAPIGGTYTTTPQAITPGTQAMAALTGYRAVQANLRDGLGTELGTTVNPLNVEGATIPASGAQLQQPGNTWGTTIRGSFNRAVASTGDALNVNLRGGQDVLIGDAAPAATGNPAVAVSGCYLQSAASTNATLCRNANVNFYGLRAINTTATLYYLRLYNLSAAPTCSSATGFIETIPIPASATGAGIVSMQIYPLNYPAGLAFCFTGGGSSTDNTNAATGVYLTLLYR